jgi:CubicO group peptidase (beta-lactamase class C family)
LGTVKGAIGSSGEFVWGIATSKDARGSLRTLLEVVSHSRCQGAFGDEFFDDRSWGFGMAVGHDGSYGWDGGQGSSFWISPGLDLTVIVLTQRMWDSSDLAAVYREIRAAATESCA